MLLVLQVLKSDGRFDELLKKRKNLVLSSTLLNGQMKDKMKYNKRIQQNMENSRQRHTMQMTTVGSKPIVC
jgi:hypothetical protein